MKKITGILFLMMCVGIYAAEIPLIDLTGPSLKSNSTVKDDAASSDHEDSDDDAVLQKEAEAANTPNLQLRTPAKQEEKIQKPIASQPQSQPQASNNTTQTQYVNQGRRLRLFLRELTIIQQAAKKAGGDIRVTIEPVGVSPEELIGPLAAANWFDIKYGQDAIVVKSKEEDPYLGKLREEVARLEEQRKSLLNDVQSLERMAMDWKSKMRSYQASPNEQEQASMEMSYPKTVVQQQQQMPPQQAYQPTSKTVVVNPEYAQQMMQGYDGQRIVIPQQRTQANYQPTMAEQPVPRTQLPPTRELPASAQNSTDANFSPNATLARHYLAQEGQVQMYKPTMSGDSQPQYQPQQSSSDSTVVLAPRVK